MKDFSWAQLLHLGTNMWVDRKMRPGEDLGQYGREYSYLSDELRFDESLWREVTAEMKDAGFNMVIIDLGEGLVYPRRPELAIEGSWSAEKLAAEVDRLKDLGLDMPVELDEPVITVKVDVARLVALLKMDTDEIQAEESRKQVDMQKGQIAKRNTDRMKKIDKSLAEMDKAARMSIFQKIFGWLTAIVTLVVAIAASVASGGVATGPLLAAVVGIGLQAMNEAGVTEKLAKELTKALEKSMSKHAAAVLSAVIMAAAQIILMLAAGGVGELAAVKLNLVRTGAALGALGTTKLGMILEGTALGMQLSGIISGGVGAKVNYDSGMASAELTETESIIRMLQAKMQLTEEGLNEIIKALMNGPEAIARLLESANDASKMIALKIGQMA